MLIDECERVLITGGSGFIGRAVVKSMISKGLRPLSLDRNASEDESNGEFDIARIDLTNRAAVGNLINDYRPNLVIHLAGVNVRDDETGKLNDETNFESTVSMLEQLLAVGTRKLVMLGTAAEYGDNPTPFREEMKPRPISSYAVSKAKASAFATDFSSRTKFDVTVLRVFTAYGPGQPRNMFISQLVRHALLNEYFNMSDGLQRRDFVFIDDVVSSLLLSSVSKRAQGRIVNVGSGRAIPLVEAANYVWDACGADPSKLLIGSRQKFSDDSFDTEADISLAKELLDWRPKIDFETGIEAMIKAERSTLEASAGE